MSKSEFVDAVASKSGLSKSDAEKAVNAFIEVIEDTLKSGGEVSFTGFGKFSVADRGARQGVNPQTGERIQIPASKVPRFSAGSGLKKAVKSSGRRRFLAARPRERPHFADRVAALVEERRSRVVLGLDPDPAALWPGAGGRAGALPARDRGRRPGVRGGQAPARLLRAPGPGRAGRRCTTCAAVAREAGLLVIADGKRGDVPVTARVYAEALTGLGADALTANPLLGRDSLEPLAAPPGAGLLRAGPHLQPRRGRRAGPRGRRGAAVGAAGAARRRAGRARRVRARPRGRRHRRHPPRAPGADARADAARDLPASRAWAPRAGAWRISGRPSRRIRRRASSPRRGRSWTPTPSAEGIPPRAAAAAAEELRAAVAKL